VDISKITIHNNKDEYTPVEALELEQAYHTLSAKAQGEEISLEETRIIVAYKRYQQDGNFKIVAEKVTKAKTPKAPKEPKEAKPKKQKALTAKEKSLLLTIKELVESETLTLESLPAQQQEFYNLNKERI
jgi:thiol:disulfide interchange protein